MYEDANKRGSSLEMQLKQMSEAFSAIGANTKDTVTLIRRWSQ